ncbi:uncharacterized protein LOC126847231 isoform X2 [Adelges cooleyi]|uniref:uncharacterized protein LOC126847231 isoform X2 n=1 Tax=Adelges cooleyi TaxID=133065 RepID=UPI00217FC66B|nr:uncharacterized protein LOC126847231 isoform X2 [Adelges cooleyi]
MGFVNIIVCFSVLASMISFGYGLLYDTYDYPPPPLKNYHYETIDQIMNSREPGSYQIMTLAEALLGGHVQLRDIAFGNDVGDEATRTRQSETGDSGGYNDYLNKAKAAASYAPLMIKIASLFVPGLNGYQTAMMVLNAATITAKAFEGYQKGESFTEIGMNVGPDIYRAVLAKRGYVDSFKQAVVPRYNSVINWITGSTPNEEVSDKQRANDAIVSFDQQTANINNEKEEMIMDNNNARLNAMSGEELLERLRFISDKLPNPKSVDIEGSFQSIVHNMDLPGLSSERKTEMASALSLTTRFIIARIMQPGIDDLI